MYTQIKIKHRPPVRELRKMNYVTYVPRDQSRSQWWHYKQVRLQLAQDHPNGRQRFAWLLSWSSWWHGRRLQGQLCAIVSSIRSKTFAQSHPHDHLFCHLIEWLNVNHLVREPLIRRLHCWFEAFWSFIREYSFVSLICFRELYIELSNLLVSIQVLFCTSIKTLELIMNKHFCYLRVVILFSCYFDFNFLIFFFVCVLCWKFLFLFFNFLVKKKKKVLRRHPNNCGTAAGQKKKTLSTSFFITRSRLGTRLPRAVVSSIMDKVKPSCFA